MRIYRARPDRKIPLGKRGERPAAKIVFPIADLVAAAGQGGTVTTMLRYNSTGAIEEYTLTLARNGKAAELLVNSAMLRTSGTGVMQLTYKTEAERVFSDMYTFEVESALPAW